MVILDFSCLPMYLPLPIFLISSEDIMLLSSVLSFQLEVFPFVSLVEQVY